MRPAGTASCSSPWTASRTSGTGICCWVVTCTSRRPNAGNPLAGGPTSWRMGNESSGVAAIAALGATTVRGCRRAPKVTGGTRGTATPASGGERRQADTPEERVAQHHGVCIASALGGVDARGDSAAVQGHVAPRDGVIPAGRDGGCGGPGGGGLEAAAQRGPPRRVGAGDGEVGDEGAAVVGTRSRADVRRVRIGGGITGPAGDTGQRCWCRGRRCRRGGGGRGGRRGRGCRARRG